MFTLSVKNLSFTIDTIWITRDGISNEKIVLESGASYNDREYWFNEKNIGNWSEFSQKSFRSFELRRSREKGFICRTWYAKIIFFFIEDLLLKQKNCESKQRTFSISPNGDGFWRVLVNSTGSENLRRSLNTTRVRITW